MIEISLQLKLESFLVNSMGISEDTSSQKSSRALKLNCEQILSGRLMTESKPTTDFEFLGSASKRDTQAETDTDFDGKLIGYLKAHAAIQKAGVNIASGTSGYVAAGKGVSSGEIGRLYIAEQSNQSSLGLELVFNPEQFDSAWELMTVHKIHKVIATLVCFKLMPGAYIGHTEYLFSAGILSCSLQFAPND
jgi:hypothetical protein